MAFMRAAIAAMTVAFAAAQDSGGTGRDLLFSNPGASLPDIYLSDSVKFASEGGHFFYSIVLTHPPGMREDETIDLDNDEVRIYLTSSQEVFQQDDDSTGAIKFQERRNHRTQLVIDTNDKNKDLSLDTDSLWRPNPNIKKTISVTDSKKWGYSHASNNELYMPLGPLPYIYKSYSTVGGNIPSQQSPVDAGNGVAGKDFGGTSNKPVLAVVCPVCSHPAYCTLFDGKKDKAGYTRQKRIIPGSEIDLNKDGSMNAAQDFMGCYQVRVTYAPVMDACANDKDTVVSDLNSLNGTCSKEQIGFTVYDGLLPRQAGGSHTSAPGWSYSSPAPLSSSTPGSSDYRIDEIGDQILRTRSDPRPLCRYSNCPELTVNGGDQSPESKNFLYPTYNCKRPTSGFHTAVSCSSTWRGDLSSSSQLVFDSTNWNVPQTVKVLAREDDVYEPEVNNRGQDAYVHHFVVSQDINLEHTYYDDIEVNDLTVSITDNDPAVVIENHNDVNPTEGSTDSNIKLRLASEPMYPVTVYLQSGEFFKPGETPVCDTGSDGKFYCNFEPDDEQVIFQDEDEYSTCWDMNSTLRTYTYGTVRDQPGSFRSQAKDLNHGGTYNYQGCFEDTSGKYVLVDAPIDLRTPSPNTRQIPATMQCHGDNRCVAKTCKLPNYEAASAAGKLPGDNLHECREALSPNISGSSCIIAGSYPVTKPDCTGVKSGVDNVGHFVESGGASSNLNLNAGASAQRTCKNDGKFLTLRTYSGAADAVSRLPTTGYTCNSFVTFSTTNWNTWQGLKVIGVNDDLDEGAFRISTIGYLYESIDWYYNSPGARLITKSHLTYLPMEDTGSRSVAYDSAAAGKGTGNTVKLSMFDTRFGKHINRYPRVANMDDAAKSGMDSRSKLEGTTVAKAWETAGSSAGVWGNPMVWGTPCSWGSNCTRGAPFHAVDAANQVCCCETDIISGTGSVTTDAASLAVTGGNVKNGPSAEDALQVQTFQPQEYANRNVQCGAKVTVTDNDARGVTISRGTCEATEGRRFWFDTFQQEPTPMECAMDGALWGPGGNNSKPMNITLGLFTKKRAADNSVTGPNYVSFADTITAVKSAMPALPSSGTVQGNVSDNLVQVNNGIVFDLSGKPSQNWANITCPSSGADGWTMLDFPDTDYEGMTAPVCPYTIVLNTAPIEGATVVVHLREQFELTNLQDHELYFYEEASYRAGVPQSECLVDLYPGSNWTNGGCFINNVPINAAGMPIPRGNTDLDVMFTDADWNVPRRITTIALNDDVDEPTQIRTIYHTVGPCDKNNHDNMEPCVEDPAYTGISVTSIDVIVVDDDIADLVVIADDGYTGAGTAAVIDENFIGSYDAAGPSIKLTTNYWYQHFERQGPYAEDGISGSVFQGRSTTPDGRDSIWGTGRQVNNDGIGQGGWNFVSGLAENGYITDNEDPACLNADPLKQDDRCFRIDNRPWTSYDPYWDVYTKGGTPYDATSASTRNTYDACTPVGQPNEKRDPKIFKSCTPGKWNSTSDNIHTPQPNRGFKGVGPAYSEPEDEFAITIHSRECANDVFGDAPAYWGTADNMQAEAADAIGDVKEGGWEKGDVEPTGYDQGSASSTGQCKYGSFKTRLNSSPGTKHVRRQYLGEPETVLEEELVHVVVTPDVTPQTMFDPVSVTFTHTGGKVDGKDTYRWDEPALFKVVPVDDKVDERAGVTIDFSSFTITQSHLGDQYWTYNNNYQTVADVGTMYVPDKTTGRKDTATPFRHHIRTIHTKDNDYSGVSIESGVSTTATKTQIDGCSSFGPLKCASGVSGSPNVNHNSHSAVNVAVTEGESFAYYTLRLDSQPRKVQRQAGTNPNSPVHIGAANPTDRTDYSLHTNGGRVRFVDKSLHGLAVSNVSGHLCKAVRKSAPTEAYGRTTGIDEADGVVESECTSAMDPAGLYHVLHKGNTKCDFEDYSDVTRPVQCGSVESEENYWVDVSVTQSTHVDLAEPKSCPNSAVWGGGATPPTKQHKRFPFNARGGLPINELKYTADHMTEYLPTCGGWQRDATYRFTADNWDVPQYVYLYAHNDKDSDNAKSGHVDEGGNDKDNILTNLKHYVETEDTLDNMERTDKSATAAVEGYVQRNKHGAQYISGNNERYPFGVLTNHTVGKASTTTKTTSQTKSGVDSTQQSVLTEPFGHRVTGLTTYGFNNYQWAYGYYKQALTWTGVHIALEACGAVHMGAGIGHAGTDKSSAGATKGSKTNSGYTGSNLGTAYTWSYPTTDASDTYLYNKSLPGITWSLGYVDPVTGKACLDPFNNQKPYTLTGAHCVPVLVNSTTTQASAMTRKASRTTYGPNFYDKNPSANPTDVARGVEETFCVPKYATAAGGMAHLPNDVVVKVLDNDVIKNQTEITPCRQTSLFSYPTELAVSSSSSGSTVQQAEWLVDYNCKNGDAGGLPGYPVGGLNVRENNVGVLLGDANVAGDKQCAGGFIGPYCTDCPKGKTSKVIQGKNVCA